MALKVSNTVVVDNLRNLVNVESASVSNSFSVGSTSLYANSSNVGIGTSAPTGKLNIVTGGHVGGPVPGAGSNLVLEDPTNVGLTLATGNAWSSAIYFSDSDGNPAWIQYNHSSDSLNFRVNSVDALSVDSSGQVGVKTSSPSAELDVTGDIQASGTITAAQFDGSIPNQWSTESGIMTGFLNDGGGNLGIRFNATPGGTNYLVEDGCAYEIQVDNDSSSGGFHLYRGASANNLAGEEIEWSIAFELDSSNNMTVGGTVTASGYDSTSDARLKEQLVPITDALFKISNLQPYEFNFVEQSSRHSGVLAQDVQQIFPHLVHEGKNGYLTVSYDELIPYLIESIKQLKNQIEELKNG